MWIIFTLLTITLTVIRIIEIYACNTFEKIMKRIQTKYNSVERNFILQAKRCKESYMLKFHW